MDFMHISSIFVFLLLMISLRGFAELVRTEQHVMAFLGEDVHLKCELTKQRNVKQVTWQRVSGQKSENMATYSKRYGSKIAESFRKNVCFVDTGLQQCSIIIKGVQWSDESCYDCLFNVFPDGAISGRTCLKIYEIHNPVFAIKPVTVSGEGTLLLSCSVTGNPAPESSWDIDDTTLENSTTFYTKNPNGTITVTKTATIQMTPRLLANTMQIKCAAQQEFGERKEISITIPSGETVDNLSDKNDKSDTRHTVFWYTVLVVGGLCICGGLYAFLKLFLRKENEHSSTTAQQIQVSIRTPNCSQVRSGLLTGSSLKKRQINPSEHPKVKKSLDFSKQEH